MKNIRLLVLLFLTILIALITGCSSESSDATNDGQEVNQADGELSGEITVWGRPFTGDGETENEMWDEVISSYEEETGVEVDFEQIAWDNADQKTLTALAANDGPDVFYVIPDQMPQYADEGMLMELDPYLEDNDMDDFVDTSLISTSWDDKLYGLPILQEAYTMIYNVEAIEEIGEDPENLPETWEEVRDWAKKAKEKDMYFTGFGGGGSMNSTLYPFIWQAGGDVVTEDGDVLINSDNSVKAWEFVDEMYKNKWIPEDSITAMEHDDLFYGGKMLAVQGSGISISNLLREDTFDFVIAPPLKEEEQVTYGTTGMFVVSSISENPDAAAEFVKVMTNTENQKKFNEVTQYIPTRESAKDIFDDQPEMSQLSEYTEFALPGVIHPAGRAIMPGIQAELQMMMEGEKTPQEAADSAAETVEAEVNN